jgi:hypothetical protein
MDTKNQFGSGERNNNTMEMDIRNQFGSGAENNNDTGMGKPRLGKIKGPGASAAVAAQSRKMDQKMKDQAESDIDLGYMGAYSNIRCTESKDIGDRLKCNHEKFSFKDPLALSEPRRKAMEKKRQGRHRIAIQRICEEEDPFLCEKKDRDDNIKEPNAMCMELKACPEPPSLVEDIPNDAKEFFKLIIASMQFGIKKDSSKRDSGDKAAMKEKIKKELEELKKKYGTMKSPGAAEGADKKENKAMGLNGGSRKLRTRKRHKYMRCGKVSKKNKNTNGGGLGTTLSGVKTAVSEGKKMYKKRKAAKKASKKAKKAAAAQGCAAIQPTTDLESNLINYKKCEKEFQKFPEHASLLKKYTQQKKMLNKLNTSPKGKLSAFKDKMKDVGKHGKALGKLSKKFAAGVVKKTGKAVLSAPGTTAKAVLGDKMAKKGAQMIKKGAQKLSRKKK